MEYCPHAIIRLRGGSDGQGPVSSRSESDDVLAPHRSLPTAYCVLPIASPVLRAKQ
jgi:hypothetical protein